MPRKPRKPTNPTRLQRLALEPVQAKPRHPPAAPTQSPRRRGAQPRNRNAAKHNFYSSQFSDAELAMIGAALSDLSLTDEIWMQRIVNYRLLKHLPLEPAPNPRTKTVSRVAEVMAIGNGRMAHLLHEDHFLTTGGAESTDDLLRQALDKFGKELERERRR